MTDDETQELDFDEMVDKVGGHLRHLLEGVFGPSSPSAVFSDPVAVGEDLVITAAAWERGGGFGFGAGQGDDPGGGKGTGGGGGGGGGSQGRPVAVIRVGRNGIEVRPVLDLTKIGVTALLSAVGVWNVLRRSR
jgi:uncharacterized spore protein YtfJ